MKYEDLNESPQIAPCNGGDVDYWQDHNCRLCKKCHPDHMEMDVDTSIKKINSRQHCEMELHLAFSFCTGTVSVKAAQMVGWSEKEGWPRRCLKFMHVDDHRPAFPAPTPKNQLDLFGKS